VLPALKRVWFVSDQLFGKLLKSDLAVDKAAGLAVCPSAGHEAQLRQQRGTKEEHGFIAPFAN